MCDKALKGKMCNIEINNSLDIKYTQTYPHILYGLQVCGRKIPVDEGSLVLPPLKSPAYWRVKTASASHVYCRTPKFQH